MDPEVADECEALAAIFGDLFLDRGNGEWSLMLEGQGATLLVRLPPGYPHEAPPVPSLEFDKWPVGHEALTASITAELIARFEPGTVCVMDWAEYAKEAISTHYGGAGGGDLVDAEGGAGDVVTGLQTGKAPLDSDAATKIGPSLEAAGFQACGPGIYVHGGGVTVETSDGDISITVDGIDAEDLSDWASMQLATDVLGFGLRLVEWVAAQRAAEPGFTDCDGGDGPDSGEAFKFLPSAKELNCGNSLELIYTWGKALRKAPPGDSEVNFNAGILNGRGGGADLRTMNGLSDEVQRNVASCSLFPRWIEMLCHKVEFSHCKVISINCTKGRHRSVAAAEILKKLYYPEAAIKHLTIY